MVKVQVVFLSYILSTMGITFPTTQCRIPKDINS